ncbi:iron(III) transport system ATP-binding protein [Pseudidiomarina planktonica]|uniref:Iron(III) transport system ATP-binding protein n=1 Tax=Pseudidiomarina planktonica TaxID=1323738 RepID=A0A1Y6EPI6_9GAMM|nr:ABC transporter ATP-binding protein [Pseudidiomarina planktonica]SMQ62880.1 iron(III) transport system ATP-binding protein [Pseudidiomarina planktonica]
MALLHLDHVHVQLGQHNVVKDVNLSLQAGDIGCLLGPSGCGKTTLLRAIAGFQTLTQGSISIADRIVSNPKTRLAPERRGVGMVFQDFALFPHLNVADNIAFGLRKLAAPEREARVNELLEHIGLPGYQHRFPHELSGGQQQRVALARALAPKPALLLLDEPFSSLDAELREKLALEVRQLLKKENITALLVTHDQQEAFAMADKAGMMYQGELLQWETPYQLYHQPSHQLVADFIGHGVLLSGIVNAPGSLASPLGMLQHQSLQHYPAGTPVSFLVRPDDVVIDPNSKLQATITSRGFRGAHNLYGVGLPDGTEILTLSPSHEQLSVGSKIGLRPEFDHLVVFAADHCELPGNQASPLPLPEAQSA